MIIASYSLNHPTLPDVRVMVVQTGPELYLAEFRDGFHIQNHYFPYAKTQRAIKQEARQLLAERRREAY